MALANLLTLIDDIASLLFMASAKRIVNSIGFTGIK